MAPRWPKRAPRGAQEGLRCHFGSSLAQALLHHYLHTITVTQLQGVSWTSCACVHPMSKPFVCLILLLGSAVALRLPDQPTDKKNQSNVQQIGSNVGFKNLSQQEVDWFASRALDKTVILTIANIGYKDVLTSWIKRTQDVGMQKKHVSVVCVDNELQAALEQQGHECLLVDPGKDGAVFKGVAFLRHLIAYALNSHGLDVMYTDADALWLQNPLPIMQSIVSEVGGPGIIGSRGNYPTDVGGAWGATLCTGVLLYHGRLPDSFWSALAETQQQINDGHDQHYLNAMLFKSGVEWNMGRLQYEESTNLDHGRVPAFDISVTLLPHNQFPRICSNLHREEVVILHCTSGTGSAASKPFEWDDAFMN